MAGSPAGSAPSNGLALASVILGAIALPLGLLGIGPTMILASLAVVLGAEGRVRVPTEHGRAMVGIVLGALSIAVGIAQSFWLLYVVV